MERPSAALKLGESPRTQSSPPPALAIDTQLTGLWQRPAQHTREEKSEDASPRHAKVDELHDQRVPAVQHDVHHLDVSVGDALRDRSGAGGPGEAAGGAASAGQGKAAACLAVAVGKRRGNLADEIARERLGDWVVLFQVVVERPL